MLEHYLIPLAPYALLASGCFACLSIFVSLKKEIRSLRVRLNHLTEETPPEELKLKLNELTDRLRVAEESTPTPGAFMLPRASLNVSKRRQAIRMSRRGDAVESIAASLNLPRREVELLLKVHALSAKEA